MHTSWSGLKQDASWSGLELDAIVIGVFAAQLCEFRTEILHGASYGSNQTDQAGTPQKCRGGQSVAVSIKFQPRNRPEYALIFFFGGGGPALTPKPVSF